jgi:hypothetical protein
LGRGGYPRVPCGAGMGGRKFPQERGGAGMGDGAGITGRGQGIGSPPQTRPIAIPNTKPKVSHFRVFDCVCYVFVPDHLRSKFDKKAIRCIFMGYNSQRKGWRCCDPTTGRCYTSRNVIFDEASSWWSEDKATLPVLKEIEEKMPESMEEQLGKDQSRVIEEIQFFEDEGEPESSEITQNP